MQLPTTQVFGLKPFLRFFFPNQEYAESVLTVPDVVNEVKSKRQIKRLVVLPFDLKVQEPDADALAYVTNFAKQTGDYASLSAIDLKVIALTYQLEKLHVGTEHLRAAPVVSRTVASKTKPEEFHVKTPLAGFYNPTKDGESDANEDDETKDDINSVIENATEPVEQTEAEEASTEADDHEDELTEEQLKACFEKLSCQPEEDKDAGVLVPEKSEKADQESKEEQEESTEDEESEEDDDDDAWITPSNIQRVKKEMAGEVEDEKPAVVACMTTDFAIQNVLKQINLNVAALNGRVC